MGSDFPFPGAGIAFRSISCPYDELGNVGQPSCNNVDDARNGTCGVNVWTLDSNPQISIPFDWDVCDGSSAGLCYDQAYPGMISASPACQAASCNFGCIREDGSCDSHYGEWSVDEWNNGGMDQHCQGSVFCAAMPDDMSLYSSRLMYLVSTWILAIGGIVVYGIYLPLHTFWHLYKVGAKGRNTIDIYQENGWVLLKYKPSFWWFEFVVIYYKIWMVCVSSLLKSGDLSSMRSLLTCTAGATVVMLVVVVAGKPFRDSEGHEGYTGADKSEILSLLCYLGELGVGMACINIRRSRDNHELTALEAGMTTLAGLFFVSFPLLQMCDRKRRFFNRT